MTEMSETYAALVANQHVLARLKREFPECNCKEVFVQKHYPQRHSTWVLGQYVYTYDPTPWTPEAGMVVDAMRRYQREIYERRKQMRQKVETTKLERDKEVIRLRLQGALDKWRERSSFKGQIGTDPDVTRNRRNSWNTTVVTVQHGWWLKVQRHLKSNPIVDDRFIVQMHEFDAPGVAERVLAVSAVVPDGKEYFQLEDGYIIEAGSPVQAYGATIKTALTTYRKRLRAAAVRRFAA